MEYLHLVEQDDRDARAFPFFDVGSEGGQQGFDVAPVDVGRYRAGENSREGSGMLAVHLGFPLRPCKKI